MAMKRFMTRAEMFELKIRKSQSRSNGIPKEERKKIKAWATLVAAFCSSLNWENYKAITEGGVLKKCDKTLLEELWRRVTSNDIVEVASLRIPDALVKKWILQNIEDEKEREFYFQAWKEFQEYFCDGKAYIIERRRGEKPEQT
jgi:hypothetical protein